nr:MAG TPA: hypothetical protein [Bacteriophage sp.]
MEFLRYSNPLSLLILLRISKSVVQFMRIRI